MSLNKPLPWGGVVVGVLLLFTACARMGSPDGGWYDDTPPYVVSATPGDQSTGITSKRVVINFNEFIKLEDAQNKVIVSPPQIEMADIKASGKRIIVALKDSLKENTTYTIDFSDAISDNNEGNPMGNYTYSFSTGTQIDTLEVSGYVLNAEDLEPIKGILVGLYSNLSDTIFKHEPMIRVSRTDSRGRFVVKGIAPGTYRAYALQDADGNFVYNQKSEVVAFSHQTFEPSWKPDTRQDTIWRDSLHIDNILRIPYTHFLPDDITLMAFTPVQDNRYLIKNERREPNRLDFYFSYGDSLPPVLRGLDFDDTDAFLVESSAKNDTIFYWLRDTALVNRDTLTVEVHYRVTDDSTKVLVNKTDTLEMLAKVSYERRMKDIEKTREQWEKEQEKKKKKGDPYDSIMPREYLKLKVSPSGSIDPDMMVTLESPTPIAWLDTAGIHLYSKVDSLWYEAKYVFRQRAGSIRQYEILADWKLDTEYSLEIDSAALADIYGLEMNTLKQGLKVKKEDDYATLQVNLSGVSADTAVVVHLLNSQGAMVKQVKASAGEAMFYYVTPGTYYLRAFIDANGNGLWDTGDYDEDRQPEDMYYYNQEVKCEAKWDRQCDWNVIARRRFEQKPGAITKQKADKEKKLQNRNAKRAQELGKEYIQKTTGVRL